MKEKRGFTLIELLAVIVILAIIALIATPIVLSLIDRARKGAAEDSAYGIRKEAQLLYQTTMMGRTGSFNKIEVDFSKTMEKDGKTYVETKLYETASSAGETNKVFFEADGTTPTNGRITIHGDGTVDYEVLTISNYYCCIPAQGKVTCAKENNFDANCNSTGSESNPTPNPTGDPTPNPTGGNDYILNADTELPSFNIVPDNNEGTVTINITGDVTNISNLSYCVTTSNVVADCNWTPFSVTTVSIQVPDGTNNVFIKDEDNHVSTPKNFVMTKNSNVYVCSEPAPIGPTISDCPNCVFTVGSGSFSNLAKFAQYCGEEFEINHDDDDLAYKCPGDEDCILFTRDYRIFKVDGNRSNSFIGLDINNDGTLNNIYSCGIANIGTASEAPYCLKYQGLSGDFDYSITEANMSILDRVYGPNVCYESSGDYDCQQVSGISIYSRTGMDYSTVFTWGDIDCEITSYGDYNFSCPV